MAALEQLLAERAKLAQRVAEIDAELLTHGVRATARTYRRTRPMRAAILASLVDGPAKLQEIVERTGRAYASVATDLWKLVAAGEVERVGRGVYALPRSVVQKGDDHAA